MPLSNVSDAVILNIATAVIALLSTVFTGVMAYFMAKLNKKAGDAAEKVEVVASNLVKQDSKTSFKLDSLATDVKATLAAGAAKTVAVLGEIKDTTDLTHAAVNGNTTVQLKIAAVALRRVADLTKGQPGHEADVRAAELAETALRDHEAEVEKSLRK